MNFWIYLIFLQCCNFLFMTLLKFFHLLYIFRPVEMFLGGISSVIHETAHYLMMKLMGMGVRWRDVNLKGGHIKFTPTWNDRQHLSFLKACMVIFCPTIVSTLGIIWVMEQFPLVEGIPQKIGLVLLLLGLFWAVGISHTDWRWIGESIHSHWDKFFRQCLEIGVVLVIYLSFFNVFAPLQESLAFVFEFLVLLGLLFGIEILWGMGSWIFRKLFHPRTPQMTAKPLPPLVSRKQARTFQKQLFSKEDQFTLAWRDLP